MPRKRSLLPIALIAMVALAGCASGSEEPEAPPVAEDGTSGLDLESIPEVVAEVNGEEIPRDEFAQAYESQLQQAMMMAQSTGQEPDPAALQQQVVQMLVNTRLLSQAAQEAGIEPTEDEIDGTLNELAMQNGMASSEELIAALIEQGLTEEEVREEAAMQYRMNEYITQETNVPEPSEEELREQYDALVEQQESMGEEAGEIPAFDEVRDQLAEQAVSEQQNAATTQLLDELNEQGDVTIHL